jgi:hypothetical protein
LSMTPTARMPPGPRTLAISGPAASISNQCMAFERWTRRASRSRRPKQ